MVLALNVSVYFCKLLPLHMNGNLPVGIGMHVFAMICDLIRRCFCKFKNFITIFDFLFIILFHISLDILLVCKSKNFRSWVYQLMIQFIVVS
eukprot:UN5116